jgi:iron complex outermembrane recepter protein
LSILRLAFFWILINPLIGLSQSVDSLRNLEEVIIEGFAYQKPLAEVPLAISVLGKNEFGRFNNTSLLPTINTVAGVRMEERSPGSFRLSIRGSSLRSPFGIRNIKFYWNGLPLTDGGGNTYLNLFDNSSISKIEIIKGPGSSLYGAGTGGVLLLSSKLMKEDAIQLGVSGGSYGLLNYQAAANGEFKKLKLSASYAHQQSDGYRQNTNMNRDALNLQLQLPVAAKGILSAALFYTDLFYQTPGGLTLAQYDTNPRQARPEAIDKSAAIYNQTIFGGFSYDYQWNTQWSTKIGLFGSVTDFKNPTILNYEKREEKNWGGRTETQYAIEKQKWKGRLTLGAELQHFVSPIQNYENVQGSPGSIQFEDQLASDLLIAFAQAEVDLPRNYFITVGSSVNFIHYQFERTSVVPSIMQKRKFDPVLSPRFALLKKINNNLSIYGSVSKGFSPPTLAEVRPSTNNYNDTLQAETGINYELGARGNFGKNFTYDVALYTFGLDQTIVLQRINNADYFINSGNTNQKGAEVTLAWAPISNSAKKVNSLRIFGSYTLNHYRFGRYIKNQQDFSGNPLTGVPPTIFVAGLDIGFLNRFVLATTVNYTDRIPLSDPAIDFASDFLLVGTRVTYKRKIGPKTIVEAWSGIDNLFDQKYSLGNDLNATAGRYYNAAPTRNYYFGLNFSVFR